MSLSNNSSTTSKFKIDQDQIHIVSHCIAEIDGKLDTGDFLKRRRQYTKKRIKLLINYNIFFICLLL